MKEIAAALGVSVSSVSLWTRDIPLAPEQVERLKARNHRYDGQDRGQLARARSARATRLAAQEHGRGLARSGDPLHLGGCMLFWAEGSKHRNAVIFTNSDPDMHRHFVRFLRECYEVPAGRILISVNCHLGNGLTLDEIQKWWLAALDLPASSVRGATVGRASSASRFKRNTLLYGTAKLTVHSTFIVQSIFGAIQEYIGVARPEWLDCTPPSRNASADRVVTR